jgi:hypothetical protein
MVWCLGTGIIVTLKHHEEHTTWVFHACIIFCCRIFYTDNLKALVMNLVSFSQPR